MSRNVRLLRSNPSGFPRTADGRPASPLNMEWVRANYCAQPGCGHNWRVHVGGCQAQVAGGGVCRCIGERPKGAA